MPKPAFDDPTFPHGTPTGYNYGCRPSRRTCPASPSCHEANKARNAERKAHPGVPGDPTTSHVQRRIRQAVEAVGLEKLMERAGVTEAHIAAVLERTSPTIPESDSLALDFAWAYLVHGTDPTDPNVEHGKASTYSKVRCRCRACRDAQLRSHTNWIAGRKTDHTILEAPGLAEHVTRLVQAHGIQAVAAASGVTQYPIRTVMRGSRARVRVIRALAATTAAECARHATLVPSATALHQSRTMLALGYPLTWQAKQAGVSATAVHDFATGNRIQQRVAKAMQELADRIGDRPATPEDGLTPHAISLSKGRARRMGYYPPAYYDENGQVDPRSIPDHPWSKIDTRADDHLRAAKLLITPGHTQEQIAQLIGHSEKWVGARAKSLGLSYTKTGVNEYAVDWSLHRDVMTRVSTVYADYEAGEVGPVTAAITLGLMNPTITYKEHPEVVAWWAALRLAYARHMSTQITNLIARTHTERQVAA